MTPAQLEEFEAIVGQYAAATAEIDLDVQESLSSLWTGFASWYSAAAVTSIAAESAAMSRGFQEVTAGMAREYIAALVQVFPGLRLPSRVTLKPVRGGVDLARVYERIVDERLRRQALDAIGDLDQESPEVLDRADDAARARREGIADTDLALARRQVEHDALQAAGVTYYRRIVRPELSRGGSCGLCIAASDRVYKVSKLMPIHTHCKCAQGPIAGGDDPVMRMNAVDLDALYEAAGGTSAAALGRVRVKTIQHGEMGPILVPSGHKERGSRQQLVDYTPERAKAVIPSTLRHLEYLRGREAAGEDVSKGIAFSTDLLKRLQGAAAA